MGNPTKSKRSGAAKRKICTYICDFNNDRILTLAYILSFSLFIYIAKNYWKCFFGFLRLLDFNIFAVLSFCIYSFSGPGFSVSKAHSQSVRRLNFVRILNSAFPARRQVWQIV